ncbi:uncharacterized protein LOC113779044 isoform X3 [Coffea eugenioides]|uniref:uncharacterized protein LOC113779044 isoform X3 n=1 Tax=Coffea eugenioides TaxID=49369 RepID=UPI000F60C8D1|nr:uncharacterized protein LOC113779044 isoform X3 [Coffea eugenioides]
MVHGKSPDELPPGWKEHVKVSNGRKIKYYTDDVTGLKFYSKKRVINFVQTKDACQGTPHSVSDHDLKSSCSKTEASPSQVVVEKNSSLEWLPQGWIIESRYRKSGATAGSVYKTYVDPLTGSKFYSKPQVMQYLESVNFNASPEKQQKEVRGDNSSKQDAPQHCESMSKSFISGKDDNGMGKPFVENEIIGDNSSKQDSPKQSKFTTGKDHISGKEGNGIGKPSLEIVYDICFQEVSGDNSFKQDAPQHCESTKGKSHISEKEENRMDKPFLEIVHSAVDESKVLDELPPGWIKEIRARKQGTRKDPYYIDPVSGYEFRSKKDALRYLEFGDISRCAITPKKRDRNDLKLVEHEVFAQPDGKKLGQALGGGQLFGGQKAENDGSFLRSIAAAPEAERSQETNADNKSTDAKISTSKVDAVQEMQLCSKEIKCDRAWENPQPKSECSKLEMKAVHDIGAVSSITTAVSHEQKKPEIESSRETPSNDRYADTNITTSTVDAVVLQICSELNNCDRSAGRSHPIVEGSNLDLEVDVNGAVSSIATALLHEQKHPQEYLDTGTQIQPKKSKKRKALSMPPRSSKRLSGQEPEILPNMGLSERALRAAVRKPGQTETNNSSSVQTVTYVSSSLTQNSEANGGQQHIDTQLQREIIADLTSCKVALLETEMQNNIEKPLQEQAVQEQVVGQVNEAQEEENQRSQDSQFWYPFGDSFSDPCYEFAFKTLTGEIPLEDTLAFPGCFQQQIETSFTEGNANFGLSEIDKPALFQNDVPSHFDSVQQNAAVEQVQPKLITPPGNINLPSCSSFGSQQPSLEARSKDYETKVNS